MRVQAAVPVAALAARVAAAPLALAAAAGGAPVAAALAGAAGSGALAAAAAPGAPPALLLVGPEGDFTPDELGALLAAGATAVGARARGCWCAAPVLGGAQARGDVVRKHRVLMYSKDRLKLTADRRGKCWHASFTCGSSMRARLEAAPSCSPPVEGRP